MVHFTCENCDKVFDRKFNLERHLNSKKNTCKTINSETFQNIPETFQNIPNHSKITQNLNENMENDENDGNVKNLCKFCFKSFSTGFNLNKHLKQTCKVKMLEEEKKQNIFENLIEKDKKIDTILNKFSVIEENNKNLQESNKNLQESNKNLMELTQS